MRADVITRLYRQRIAKGATGPFVSNADLRQITTFFKISLYFQGFFVIITKGYIFTDTYTLSYHKMPFKSMGSTQRNRNELIFF